MKQSANSVEYVIQPPDFPNFSYKHGLLPFREMVEWAKKEYQARLIYCAERGYWKHLKIINEEYSPYRILAELHGFRRFCSYLNHNAAWASADCELQDFIIKSYQLRDMLLR